MNPKVFLTNQVLGFVRSLFLAFAEREALVEFRTEIRRQDSPDATLTWVDVAKGEISKSIHFQVDNREYPFLILVRMHAWRDIDEVRKWHWEELPQRLTLRGDEVTLKKAELQKLLAEAYRIVSSWTEEILTTSNSVRSLS